jgi:WD40 repeat protein/tRNA A-37 threonylcarbamoyl transferase component Bud32
VHTPISPVPAERTLKIHHTKGEDEADALPRTNQLSPATTPPPQPPDPGFPRVRGYEVLALVGTGGMGVVYEARHRQLNRRVAIKTLRGEALADPDFRDRFRAEAQAIARLQHPNIIQVFEIGTVEALPFEMNPSPFIALEFVNGGSLAQRTREPQPARLAARTIETLARAAHAAHVLGVIHRDLKPANVLLTPEGEPKIADFGIAKQLGNDPATGGRALTRTGLVVGTPEYMAPEQFEGAAATAAIDIYALGVILYELLTARVPFQGVTWLDTMRLTLHQEPVQPRCHQPGVSRDLETICLKCLEKNPARRYESAEALADDLARWAEGRPIRARALGKVERTARWVRRNPAVAVLSAAVCLLAMTGLAGVVWGWSESNRNAQIAGANARAAEASALTAKFAEQDARAAAQNERWERYRVSVMAASGALRLHDTEAARRALDSAPVGHRDWVWDLLRAELDRSRAVLRGRGNQIRAARFSADGRWAVLQCYDGTHRVWDVLEQKEHLLEPVLQLRSPVLSPDGALLAFGPGDETVVLREMATGRTRVVLRGHTGIIEVITFTHDGNRVITTSTDSTVRIWNARSGQQLHLFQAPADAGSPLVVSPDERFVAARGLEGVPAARVWDLKTGLEVAALGGHERGVHFVQFSPTGDRLVTAERFPLTNLYLWDVATGKRLATLKGHQNQVTSALFSPDGTRLVTTSTDRTARVWDVTPEPAGRETEALLVLQGHSGWVNHVAFSPDGTRLVSSSQDRTVRYWNARTGEQIAVLCGHTDQVVASAFRANSTELVSASADGTLRLWDGAAVESGYAIRGHENFVYSGAFFPDGKRLVSTAWDGTARVWNATTGRELLRLDHGEERYVVSVAVHSGGRFLATMARREGSPEESVRLWDASTGRLLARWAVPIAWQDSRVAFAPQGDLFAAGGLDGRVRMWDANTRSEVAVLECGKAPIREVAFSPDVKWLAVACDDGDCTVRIWDVSTREQIRVLRGHTQGVYTVAWNRAGTMLASGSLDKTVRLWDVATWTTIEELRHSTDVYGVAFSAEGKLLACACADNLVRIWDVNTRRELAELSGHRSYVHHLAFSPDGTRMVSVSGDRTLRVWDTLPRAERERR